MSYLIRNPCLVFSQSDCTSNTIFLLFCGFMLSITSYTPVLFSPIEFFPTDCKCTHDPSASQHKQVIIINLPSRSNSLLDYLPSHSHQNTSNLKESIKVSDFTSCHLQQFFAFWNNQVLPLKKLNTLYWVWGGTFHFFSKIGTKVTRNRSTLT